MRTLISGGTGFVGSALVKKLASPVLLTRQPDKLSASLAGLPAFKWGASAEPPPLEAFKGVKTVIHLSGEGVASKRFS